MTLCEKATTVIKDDDGKEEKREDNIYLTQYERLDGNSGIVQAAVHQVEGQDKQFFMVAIPLDIQIKPGLRVSIYPKDQWELVQKNDKIDETKLKGIKLGYTVCYPAGCAAGVEATGELLNDLRTSGGFVVLRPTLPAHPSTLWFLWWVSLKHWHSAVNQPNGLLFARQQNGPKQSGVGAA